MNDLSNAPNSLFNISAEEVNSNILRMNIKDTFGLPVDMSNIGLDIFVKGQPRDPKADEVSVIQTLNSPNSLKIHRFNQTVPESALVLTFNEIAPNLSLRALLNIGQQPTLKEYSLTTELTANNLTSGYSSLSWVIPRDVLRNITKSSESVEYFLGVSSSEGSGLINRSYSLHVTWTRCLLLEEGLETWTSSGCEVGIYISMRMCKL